MENLKKPSSLDRLVMVLQREPDGHECIVKLKDIVLAGPDTASWRKYCEDICTSLKGFTPGFDYFVRTYLPEMKVEQN